MSVSGSPDRREGLPQKAAAGYRFRCREAPAGVKGCRKSCRGIQIPVPGSPGGHEGLPQKAAAGYRFRLGLAMYPYEV